MNKLLNFILLLLFIFTVNCVQLKSISINSQPSKEERSSLVQAKTNKFIFLAFNFDNEFLEDVPSKLRAKCQDGKIKGIITKFELISYFLFFDYVVTASGYCVKEK